MIEESVASSILKRYSPHMDRARRKLKRGDTREDGFVFWAYAKHLKSGQHWISPNAFAEKKKRYNENMRKWREKNPEKPKEQCKKWREKNRQRHRELTKKWKSENQDRAKQNYKNWAKRNKEYVLKKHKEWCNKNKDKISNWKGARRAKERKSLLSCSANDIKLVNEIYKLCKRVSKCTGIKHEVDHIIPISKGGPHIPTNLQVIPSYFNRCKGAKLDYDLESNRK